MFLYEIPQAYLEVLEKVDPETGEIDSDALDAIQDSLHHKADTYAKVINSLNASNEVIEKEIDRLQGLMNSNEKKVKTLKDNLMNAMLKMDDEKFKTDLFSFNVRMAPSQALVINESAEVPDKYTKTIKQIDKAKIKDDLKKGEKLDFAYLAERKQYLQIK